MACGGSREQCRGGDIRTHCELKKNARQRRCLKSGEQRDSKDSFAYDDIREQKTDTQQETTASRAYCVDKAGGFLVELRENHIHRFRMCREFNGSLMRNSPDYRMPNMQDPSVEVSISGGQ
jgi:hypothetical protein